MRRILTKKRLVLLLPIGALLLPRVGLSQEASPVAQEPVAEQEVPIVAPDLADIIPQATELARRLAALESPTTHRINTDQVHRKIDIIEAELGAPADQLKQTKEAVDYKYSDLVAVRQRIQLQQPLLERIGNPLSQEIRSLEAKRTEWLAAKNRWIERQTSLFERGDFEQLKPTFANATENIDKALILVTARLGEMLEVQKQVGLLQAKIDTLTSAVEKRLDEKRRGALLNASPPLFSARYRAQFHSGLWTTARNTIHELAWPGKKFAQRQGWIVVAQALLSLLLLLAISRKKKALNQTKRWQFMSARPFSTALFLGYMATIVVYEYAGTEAPWKFILTAVAAVSFARICSVLIKPSWKRQFIYGLLTVLILSLLIELLHLPLPLARLYTVIAALVSAAACLTWAKQSSRIKESRTYAWMLWLGALFLAVIVIAEVWGKTALALYLFLSLLDSVATLLVFLLLLYILHGVWEWLFYASMLGRSKALKRLDGDAFVQRVARLVDVSISALVLLPAILMTWGFHDTLGEATKGFLAIGFNLGSQRINVGIVLAAAGIMYGSYLLSWVVQQLLLDEVIIRRQMEKGVRHAIGRLLHYVIICIAFLMALSTLGFEITKLTIALSALGIGIGFGLQNIVNNFVSGIILLSERPVRVGDTIEINGNWAEIKRIGLRATTVQTFDQADVIIPNADLVSNQVTNWTLSNRQVRLIVPVGVAYGSDVPLVIKTLATCAKEHDLVSTAQVPQVLFLSFGESSLDFELRVWVTDADNRLKVKSDLHQAIDRTFRAADIEIAFPQRDLHLRSMDKSIALPPAETA